jgi:hypothetical protein
MRRLHWRSLGSDVMMAGPCVRPGAGCEFRVKMLPDSPVTYSIPLKKVETFALHGTVAGLTRHRAEGTDQAIARTRSGSINRQPLGVR